MIDFGVLTKEFEVTRLQRRILLILFFTFTLPICLGNFCFERGDIAPENGILQKDNFYRISNETVRNIFGFEGSTPFVFEIRATSVKEGVEKTLKLHDKVETKFDGCSVGSIKNILGFLNFTNGGNSEDDEGVSEVNFSDLELKHPITKRPYFYNEVFSGLTKENTKVESSELSEKRWVDAVMQQQQLARLVFRKEGSEFIFPILVFPNLNIKEDALFWKIVEIVEERVVPEWEKFLTLKKDLHIKDPQLHVAGAIPLRGSISAGLVGDIRFLTACAAVFTFGLFYLFLGAALRAALATGLLLYPIAILRGWAGFMSQLTIDGGIDLGFGFLFIMSESVFALFPYVGIMLQAASFAYHKFEELEEPESHLSIEQKWRNVRKEIARQINLTAFCATAGLATLCHFELFGIEFGFGIVSIHILGILSAVGTGFLWLVVRFVLPAVHIELAKFDRGGGKAKTGWLNRQLKRWSDLLNRWVLSINQKGKGGLYVVLTLSLLGSLCLLGIDRGLLIYNTDPVGYGNPDGAIVTYINELNKKDGPGTFEFGYFITPSKKFPIPSTRVDPRDDPQFMLQVWNYMNDIK